MIVGLLLVSQVAPQIHRIYYDEDIYANMSQNIACTNQAGMANYGTFEYGEYFVHWLLYNKDPAGWPFLMSMVFQLFGVNETFTFYLNNVLYAGGIVIVFFIAKLLTGGLWFPALLAALVYALVPHNLIWANTISPENAAAVFGGLAVLSALYWLKTREARRLFLSAVVIPFACNMRPESSLIALVIMAAIALNIFADRDLP
jgi:4-amino-4-deoxy-L-arabinose transferase-like glycosyltransferase